MSGPSGTDDGEVRSIASEFWLALTQHSLASLLGALAVTASLFVLTLMVVDQRYVSRIQWSREDNDQYGALTSRALHVSNQHSQSFSVALLTASSVRDAVLDSNLLCAAASDGWDVKEVKFANLSSGALTFWEMLSVADYVSDGFQGLVIIEVAPNKFCRGDQELTRVTQSRRLGLQSKMLAVEHASADIEAPRSTGIYAYDNHEFCLARRYRLLAGLLNQDDFPSMRLQNTGIAGGNPRVWEDSVKMKRKFLAHYFEEVDRNAAVLAAVIECFQGRGDTTVVLVESPYNPVTRQLVYSDPAYGVILSDYRQRIDAITRQYKISYWDVLKSARLSSEDFIDDYHLANPDARGRYTDEIARRIVDLGRSDKASHAQLQPAAVPAPALASNQRREP